MSSRIALALVILPLLAACAGSPAVKPPALDVELPSTWTGGEADVVATTESLAADWWTGFGDDRLDAIIQEALAHNHDLAAARSRLEQAAAAATIGGADLYPSLDANASGSRRKQIFVGLPIPGDGIPGNTSESYSLGLSTSWELDLWGRVRKGASAAEADYEAAQAVFAGAQLSLAARTSKAWFGVIEARAQLELARETLESYEFTTATIRDRFERGLRPSLDLRLGLAELETAAAQVAARQQQFDAAVRQLEVLLGRFPAASLQTVAELPAIVGSVPAGLPAELLQRRHDLSAAERRLAAAGARVGAAKRALLPRISLTGSAGTTSNQLGDLVDGDFGVWSLVGNLVQPIFQGGRLRAQVKQAGAVEHEALSLYADTALRAFAEVESALAAESFLARQDGHVAEAARQSKAAHELAGDRYRSGLSDLITLLSAQRSAAAAQSQSISVKRRRLDARVDLILALGGGFGATDESQELSATNSKATRTP